MAVATQTAAAPSTATPLPTVNRAATATPTINPGEPPLITYLAPDRERIRAGESAVLTWETRGATAAALRANGTEQSVALAGSITLTPDVTTTYRLIARNSAGEDAIDVTIAVDPPEPESTPTATPAPATMTPEAGALPSDAAPVVPIQSATDPPTSTPTATMMPSATPTEPLAVIDTSTPTPILLATLTPTPHRTARRGRYVDTNAHSTGDADTNTDLDGGGSGSSRNRFASAGLQQSGCAGCAQRRSLGRSQCQRHDRFRDRSCDRSCGGDRHAAQRLWRHARWSWGRR